MYMKIAGAGALAILTATSALAGTGATATTDLNLRAAPGPNGQIVDVIPGAADVTVEQCATQLDWCRVSYNGSEGWAYSPYLEASLDSKPVIVRDHIRQLDVKTIDANEDERNGATAAGGMAGGMLALSLVTGPLAPAAIAASAVAGAAVGHGAVPEKTVTYVHEHPLQPVYMNGEIVRGAGIPEGVDLTPIPDSDYTYMYLNGAPVVVDHNRTIVKIIR